VLKTYITVTGKVQSTTWPPRWQSTFLLEPNPVNAIETSMKLPLVVAVVEEGEDAAEAVAVNLDEEEAEEAVGKAAEAATDAGALKQSMELTRATFTGPSWPMNGML
jgi:hypothetical protein